MNEQADAIRSALPHASASFLRRNAAILGAVVAPPAFLTLPAAQKPVASPSARKKRASRPTTKGVRRVARTRNAGTWTEARYWQTLRSGLRRMFRFWKPAIAALQAARVPCTGKNRQKWAYICADCKRLFPRKEVQIDHVEPVGSLLCLEDVAGFIKRLTPEDPAAFAVRCRCCHQQKTNQERR